jgi:hypothetical protein
MLIGFLVVNSQGNYETIYGAMLFGGAAGSVISMAILLIKLFIFLL